MENIIDWLYKDTSGFRSFSWTCPYCDRTTTITDNDRQSTGAPLQIDNDHGPVLAVNVFVVCPNPDCKKFTYSVLLFDSTVGPQRRDYPSDFPPLATWQLIPPSEAKTYPNYVPTPIRADYEEACLIRDLSPKASATLSRRCLQGMIRDYWNIVDDNLYKEIAALKGKVAPKTWQAIDAVRGVGNIGAHMEKDINVIVDVEPEEAAMLIGLIEMLVEDWYINEHERDQKLSGIINLGALKKQAKKLLPPASREADDQQE